MRKTLCYYVTFAWQETCKMPELANTAWLGIGGNIGDRQLNIDKAIQGIRSFGSVTQISKIIETKAWGITDRPDYLNLVLELKTNQYPHELLKNCKKLELELGREKTVKWDSRIIDIDILYFNDWSFTSNNLTVPHPFIQERDFVLKPMAEIAPFFIHPKLKHTQLSLLEKLNP